MRAVTEGRDVMNEGLVEDFQRDGAVRIPSLFSAAELADLAAGIDIISPT